jgi:hypothetical protein
MADLSDPSNIVTRTSSDGAMKLASRRQHSPASKAGQAAMWAALMVAGALTLIPICTFAEQQMKTWALLRAEEAEVRAAIAGDWANSVSADYVETVSELSLSLPQADTATAYAAAERATGLDASRAHAWARLAWLDYSKDKKVTPAVLDRLAKSMDACPMCDQDLMRWRFNFVLANWRAIPEPLRARSFEQADLLRWTGNNHLFLADMSLKANRAGIAFDKYRMAVNTPVRTLDLGFAPPPAPKDGLAPGAAAPVDAPQAPPTASGG